jgi:hypothetical protein
MKDNSKSKYKVGLKFSDKNLRVVLINIITL